MLSQPNNLQSTIESAQQGDRDAFARLVDEHYDLMFRVAMKYTGNPMDAEDVTHESCIKLARFINQFRFESLFSSWLYRLVINCARDMFKARKLSDQRDEVNVPEPEELPTGQNNAESVVILQQVLQKVEQMGDGFWETVVLVVGEELTHSEAAVVLGVKESTVSWRMFEMRKRLKASDPQEAS